MNWRNHFRDLGLFNWLFITAGLITLALFGNDIAGLLVVPFWHAITTIGRTVL